MASNQVQGPNKNENIPQWQRDVSLYFNKQFKNEIQELEFGMLEIIQTKNTNDKEAVKYNKDWEKDIEGPEVANEELVSKRTKKKEIKFRKKWRERIDGEEVNMEELVQKRTKKKEIKFRKKWKDRIDGEEMDMEELVQEKVFQCLEAKRDVEFSQDWEKDLDGKEVSYEEQLEDPYKFDKDDDGFWTSPIYRDIIQAEDADQDKDECLYFESDFEDEEESVYESDFEEDEEEEDGYENVNLQNGITMTLPKIHREKVQQLYFKPWNAKERHKNLPELDVYNMEMFCTDVFELSYIDETNKGYNKVDVFKVPEKDIDKVTLKVPISHTEKGKWYNYQARIFSRNQWKRTKATLFQADGYQYVRFNAHEITSICITQSPKNEGCTVKKDGYTFKSRKDNRVQVNFPSDSVRSDKEMQFVLYPVDRIGMEWRLKHHPQRCNILAMADCLYVNGSLPKLNRPVIVNLPISEKVEDSELVFFHWKNDKIQIIQQTSEKKMKIINECCTISVDSFSGYAGALIRSGSLASISPVEIEVNRGVLKQCTILVFVKELREIFFSLWVEIVSIDKVEETTKNREKNVQLIEIPFCKSPDLFLYDKQRIRVHVSGNVKCVQTKEKFANTLTFLHTGNDNHIVFPLQIYRRMDGVPFAMIDFIDDCGRRRRLHTAHFDPDRVLAREPNAPRTQLYKRPSTTTETVQQPQWSEIFEKSKTSLQPQMESMQENVSQQKESRLSENKEFFTDQSMIMLATKLPSSVAFEFGIHLGIDSETINRLKTEAGNEVSKYHFSLLKRWLSTDMSTDRLHVLVEALKNCDQCTLAHKVEQVYPQGRKIKKEDLKH